MTTKWEQRQTIRGKAMTARNTASTGIHSNEFAQKQGFERAVVAGPNFLSFVATMFEQELGDAWLRQGRIGARFTSPVYDGEELLPAVSVSKVGDDFAAEWTLSKTDGTEVAKGTASLMSDRVTPPASRSSSPKAELLDLANLEVGERIPAESVTPMREVVHSYSEQNQDPLAREGRVPTAYLTFLLFAPARQFLNERGVGPGMWGEIDIRQHAPLQTGETYAYSGEVVALRRRGQLELVDFEFSLAGTSGEPLCSISHTHIIPHRDSGATK